MIYAGLTKALHPPKNDDLRDIQAILTTVKADIDKEEANKPKHKQAQRKEKYVLVVLDTNKKPGDTGYLLEKGPQCDEAWDAPKNLLIRLHDDLQARLSLIYGAEN